MNEVFIIGKVASRVNFNFLIKCSKISKATSLLELENKCCIQIVGFNNVADLMYSKLKIADTVLIYGKIIEGKIFIKFLQIL